jgi:glycosyltransferase involved in cell wall biosynthesis
MKENGYDVIMISSPGPEAEAVERNESCEMITLPMKRTVSIGSDIVSLFRLYRILKVLKPDIVHTHTPKAGLLGMLAAKMAKVPVRLHTIAGLPWIESNFLMKMIYKNVERLTAWASHRLYANSEGMLQFLRYEKITMDPEKIKLLGQGSSNGIDCNFFNKKNVDPEEINELLQKSQIDSNSKIWIFIGRIVKDKGINELVNAFIQFQQFYPNDQLWLVGDEEQSRDPLSKDTINKIKLNENILQWGHQQDVRPFLALAYALVFPSYREGFPNVPMQAGAMECPLILSDIKGCNEIVEHDFNGLLIKTKDVQSIVSAMTYLRRNPTLCEKFATESRKIIADKFKQDVIWQLLLTEYNDFLELQTDEFQKKMA